MKLFALADVGPQDWSAFLSRQDPVWQRLPQGWQDAPFAGNGTQGLMIYQTGPRTLRLLLGSSEVQDHRPGTASFERARLPVGYFDINTVGDLQGCDLRIDLWNAEIRGTIQTSRGTLDIRALVLMQPKAIWVQTKPSGDESAYTLKFTAGKADSPRTNPHYKRDIPKDYTGNPDPRFETNNGITVCVQPLTNAQTATAWKEQNEAGTRTLFCSIAHTFPGEGAEKMAVDTVRGCFAAAPATLLNAHRAWWHNFYPASFVTLPDAYWQSFYWIQMYKLGSATRADGPLIDNHGPWLADTPWPYATWNMNVPLTYWPMATSNHVDLGYSLSGALTRHLDALIDNVPAEYRADSAAMPRATTQDLVSSVTVPSQDEELDNLTWACDDVWMLYRATMDDQFLRADLYPVLRRSVNYDLHFLIKGADRKLHFPTTMSPEYGPAPDANYNLSLLRWGCHVLLASSERLKIDAPLRSRWREVLADLTPYPQDEHGFLIGAGVPLAHPHRHFSHLLMIYPLHLLDHDDPKERAVMQTSLDWWMRKPQGQGFQFDGAAAMAATLGEGDQAFAYLNELHARKLIRAATMYAESGPVIETPLAAAQCLNEMMLQSAGVWKTDTMPTPVIRVFPAMPAVWRDAAFQDLRAQGAFLVSAVRTGGQTQWIRIESLAGERAFLRPGIPNPTIKGVGLKQVKEGLYEVNLKRGQSVELLAAGLKTAPAIKPVAHAEANPFGLKLTP